jgi:uncharacterized membrane protein
MNHIFKGSNGVALGIFITLPIGLLLKTFGTLTGWSVLTTIGTICIVLMAPAIGLGIAYMLEASPLVIFSSMIASTIGSGAITIVGTSVMIKSGDPIGALLTAIVATYIGKRISGKTPLDMILTPFATILVSGLVGLGLSKFITPILTSMGAFIKTSTEGSPLIASIILAVVWGLFLVSPASSVALAIALNLNGIAGGAVLAGCAAHYVGFSIISWKENNLGGVLAQGLCTPKVQLPNITKNPMILIPTLLSSAVAGPVSALVFGIQAPKEVVGLGIGALVAPMQLLTIYDWKFIIPAMLISLILIPAVISPTIYLLLKKKGFIKEGDLKLPN